MPQKPDKPASRVRRYLPLGATYALALLILGGTILYATLDLRAKSRQQITAQHARILYALWLSQKFNDEPEDSSAADERASDQLPAVLQMARLQFPQLAGLIGTRLFDASGTFVFGDPNIVESTLAPQDLAEVCRLNPVAHLFDSVDMSQVVLLQPREAPARAPLLEVTIPLHSPKRRGLLGIAQFLLDGTSVAHEFVTLDRNLVRQGLLTFITFGGLLGVVLGLGFHQLQRVNRLLSERTRSLLQANQELALAAKTSAVGAVTAHLIHGLKNPLSGLQTFVAAQSAGEDPSPDWELAVSSARRMQSMIGEIVRVLRDEEVASQYEVSLDEFAQMLRSKVLPLAREAGVEFDLQVAAEGVLRNREANLLSLVLYNLVQNAIQASPKGKHVSVSFRAREQQIVCEVKDEGAGVPAAQREQLFKPCRSTKHGGSGIGLAISKQLAGCIGAQLELQSTGVHGSVFALVFAAVDPAADGIGAGSASLGEQNR
jgi:signal transduction histidine kinase